MGTSARRAFRILCCHLVPIRSSFPGGRFLNNPGRVAEAFCYIKLSFDATRDTIGLTGYAGPSQYFGPVSIGPGATPVLYRIPVSHKPP